MNWVLTLPIARPLMTQNTGRGKHWKAVQDAKLATELIVGEAVKKAKLQPIGELVSVRLVYFMPDLVERDSDGLAVMMKAVVDALVKKGILKGDSYKHVYETCLGPLILSRKDPHFEVHIQTVGEAMPTAGQVEQLYLDHFPTVAESRDYAWCSCGLDLAHPYDADWADHMAEIMAETFGPAFSQTPPAGVTVNA